MDNKQKYIHDRGFNMFDNYNRKYTDIEEDDDRIKYGKIKVGPKTLDDAVISLGTLHKINKCFCDKREIYKAIYERDLIKMREISNFFYYSNGIYARICDYFAFLYRYDWYIVPEIKNDGKKQTEKILTDFNNVLSYFDETHVQKICGDIALKCILDGAYYGYRIKSKEKVILQELPINYCRNRYSIGDKPVVEFNMRFFDEKFADINERMKILKMFPEEFQKGYVLYKQNKLTEEFVGSDWENRRYPIGDPRRNRFYKDGWYPLEPGAAVKFSIHHSDQPLFINAIPPILDLDEAQDLDKRKQLQQLQKIVIQQLPLDKNGDLIFDVDEAADIHNNAVQMLRHAIGTDVLTTFADISVEDVAETNASEANDNLDRVERTVYNSFGTSRNLFNTDGNMSLEKSILDDAASIRNLILQFSYWFNDIAKEMSSNKKKWVFKFNMLETTVYNYTDIAKMYKEQVQMGYSKMLPQVALGHSQSSIIHTAYFENEVLKLSEIMIPPISSSTMSADLILGKNNQNNTSQNQKSTKSGTNTTSNESAGRPEKPDDQKSDKTIANRESMS